ncbi:MAG: YtxH domain-containing protein [Anaerolineales bacterium]|nr:YtxH domain-containing protein [Anaerolineales bacterium]
MKKAMSFVFGAVMGGILGGLTALLLAPYSGEELRSVIHKQIDSIQIEIKDAALKKRAELEGQLEELINPKDS